MKMKRSPLWVMAAVWIALGLLLDGYLHCRVRAGTQTGLTNVQVKKIGVVPFFKGRHTAEVGETLNCPLCQLYFKSENISPDSDRMLTEYVQEALESKHGEKVIPLAEVRKAYERIPKDELIDTPRAIATRVGEFLKADLMIVGSVWRYKERVGGALAVQSPASVAFVIYVIEVATGKTVWKAKFDQTQRPLSENILEAKRFLKRGAKWLSANELAQYGVKEIFKGFPL
jgi:hypothetical protein